MSDEKSNGHNAVTVEMVEILKRIEGRLDAFQKEAHEDQVKLRAELNVRLDAMQEQISANVTDRLNKLEERMAKVEARPARRPGARR